MNPTTFVNLDDGSNPNLSPMTTVLTLIYHRWRGYKGIEEHAHLSMNTKKSPSTTLIAKMLAVCLELALLPHRNQRRCRLHRWIFGPSLIHCHYHSCWVLLFVSLLFAWMQLKMSHHILKFWDSSWILGCCSSLIIGSLEIIWRIWSRRSKYVRHTSDAQCIVSKFNIFF